MGVYLDIDDVVTGHPLAEKQLAGLRSVVEAARCIRHWHDRHPDGMVVSAEHVRVLWQTLDALDEANKKVLNERH